MVRPTLLLRAIAESSTPTYFDNIRPLRTYSRSALKQAKVKMPSNLVLNEIPKTATPGDVLRELRAAGAVGEDFSVTNIVPMPPSLPRHPSLLRQFHLTLPSPTQAETVASLLSTTPLFPSYFPSRPRGSSRHQPVLARIHFTPSNAPEWRASLCLAAENILARRALSRENRAHGGAGGEGSGGFGKVGYGRDLDVVRYDADWVGLQGVSGRRVIVQGFPFSTGSGRLKSWLVERIDGVVIESGLEEGEDSVVKLPSSTGRRGSVFGLTYKTIADATRAARRLNMTTHQQTKFANGETIIRAEVVW